MENCMIRKTCVMRWMCKWRSYSMHCRRLSWILRVITTRMTRRWFCLSRLSLNYKRKYSFLSWHWPTSRMPTTSWKKELNSWKPNTNNSPKLSTRTRLSLKTYPKPDNPYKQHSSPPSSNASPFYNN